MYNLVRKIFDEEKISLAYRRINSSHPIDIYLGYNKLGEKSLVIVEMSLIKESSSTKLIKVIFEKREDGKTKLEFTLTDNKFEELFYKFCEDIILSSQNSLKENAIKGIINRWNAWRIMFQNITNEILPDCVIQGLIGELLFIKNHMIPHYGVNKTIVSWEGPLGGHKDFVVEKTWYEIKTCSPSCDTIKISSLEQLDSEDIGYLTIIRMEKSNMEDANAINLNILVEDVKNEILSFDILNLFYEKLSSLKYSYNSLYDKIAFKIITEEVFEVDKDFPCIRRRDVPIQVQAVQYELRISNLKEG